jgi:ABC-2 type transport system permease protein
MIASYRAEALKSRKRWANWIMIGILVGLVLLLYLVTYAVLSHPPRNFESRIPASVLKREDYPENLLPNIFSTISTLGAGIMIIFGGLSTASEYGWLTVQTILVQKPGRTAVLLGKQLNLAVIAFLVSVVVLAGAAGASYLILTIDGGSSNWPSANTLLKGFGGLWLQLAVWTAFGMFLGIAFRSTAAAIGGGLVYLFVIEAIVAQLFRDTDIVKEVLKVLPGINAGAVNAAFPLTFRSPNAATPLVSASHGVITLIAYLAAFTIVSLLIFQRRDVTGA